MRIISALVITASMLITMSGVTCVKAADSTQLTSTCSEIVGSTLPSVTGVAAIPDITVVYGTSIVEARAKLPNTVLVTLSNGRKVSSILLWNMGSPLYYGNVAGTYTFTSPVLLLGATIPKNFLKVQAKVVVTPQPVVTVVEAIPDITVDNGTSLSAAKAKLPSTILVTLSNGNKVSPTLSWDKGSPLYNGNVAGTYTFTSPLLWAGVTIPDKFKKVQAKVVVTPQPMVTVVEAIPDITVDNGTSLSAVKAKLPSTILVTLSNGNKVSPTLSWDKGSPLYNGNVAGTYTFTAKLLLTGVTIPNNFKTVQAKIVVTNVVITGVGAIPNIIVDYGTSLSAAKANLPSTVLVTLSNGKTVSPTLSWDEGSPLYDGSSAGTYIFTAPLLVGGAIIPDNFKTVQAQVVVTPQSMVTEVGAIPNIIVDYGTSLTAAKANLPSTVLVTLSNGKTVSPTLSWDEGSPLYDGSSAGTYIFTAPLLVGGVIIPDNLKTVQATIVVTNAVIANGTNDPNPSTKLNTSPGIALFEFDSAADWKGSDSGSVGLDVTNYVSGNASAKLGAVNPISVDGTGTTYFSVQTTQNVNDRLQDMKNIEFNLFVPDKTQIDYLVVNFYTDSSHNYFFQDAIGMWELSPGWNKIRRPLADLYFVNSIPSVSSTSETATILSETSSGTNAALTNNSTPLKGKFHGAFDVSAEKAKLKLKVNNFNKMLSKKNKALQMQSSNMINALAVPATWDSIDNVEIFVASNVGAVPSVNFDKIAYNVTGAAKLLFTFDDAWYDVKEYAEPILSAKGFKATTWANLTDSVASDDIPVRGPLDVMNEADLTEMYTKGWDIGNHTANHVDDITTLTNDQLRQEYLVNQNWLLSKGWDRGAYHACYPSGSYNDNLIDIIKGIGVKTGRVTEYGIQPTPVYNIYKLKTVFISRDTTVADITAQINKAVETGSTIFFMLHRVEQTPDPTNDSGGYNALAVSTENFSQIVEYVSNLVSQGKLEVDTISEWYEEYTAN